MEQHVKRIIRNEQGRLTEAPPWYPSEERLYTVPAMKPGMTPILVTGDANRNKIQTMPGGGYATIEIRLPANWDALLAPLGYEPLANFLL